MYYVTWSTKSQGKAMSEILNLCGLWKRTDKSGKEYLVGKLTMTTRLMVFTNQNKNKPTDPDYCICLGREDFKKEQQVKKEEPVKEKEFSGEVIPF